MSADFDNAAITYDQDFTYSDIGTLQRQRVWRLLDNSMNHSQKLKILELNCGTGEDAGRLAKGGNRVVATDISEEMLNVAREKNQQQDITFQKLDLNNIDRTNLDSDFDLVFSNFGGLNCIDPDSLAKASDDIYHMLKPKGKFIAVIMPKMCVWDIIYQLFKGRVTEIFRRNRDVMEVTVSGKIVKTWYYNPRAFSSLMSLRFVRENLKPIGLFIPPSYLEGFFKKRKFLLKFLGALEMMFANLSFQAKFSDHYYIEFRKT